MVQCGKYHAYLIIYEDGIDNEISMLGDWYSVGRNHAGPIHPLAQCGKYHVVSSHPIVYMSMGWTVNISSMVLCVHVPSCPMLHEDGMDSRISMPKV